MPDFLINDQSSFAVLIPNSDEGQQVVNERFTNPETLFYAGGVCIEHRYAFDIFLSLKNEGFTFAPF